MSEQPPGPALRIFTIGHSNHSAEEFLDLLREQRIEVVVDVRSQPYSRYTPHFTAQPLKETLTAAGIRYLYLGKELGGRPDGDAFYDDSGHVLYNLVACSPVFLEGIDRLTHGIDRFRVAMLCAEEDPAGCHRRLLVGRVLVDRGIAVLHIRGDGRVQPEEELRAAERREDTSGQLALFEAPRPAESAWRSVHPIRPARSP